MKISLVICLLISLTLRGVESKCSDHPSICVHGTCVDYDDSYYCNCDEGWALNSTFYCTVCAFGYTGSNCLPLKPISSAVCDYPTLPQTLNSNGNLVFGRSVNFGGEFLLNPDAFEHETQFSLSVDSVFRIHVEWNPNFFYELTLEKHTNMTTTIAEAYETDKELMLHLNLSKCENSTDYYSLKIVYFQVGLIDCHTIMLQLRILPTTDFDTKLGLHNEACANISAAAPTLEQNKTIVADYVYKNTAKLLFANPIETSDKYNVTAVFDWRFIIPPTDKRLQLVVLLGSEFAYSEVSVVLQRGDRNEFCGYANNTSPTYCTTAKTMRNTHYIATNLQTGSYHLIVYAPNPLPKDVSKCFIYDMTVQISYFGREQTVFTCPNLEIFPEDLNALGFLSESTHRIRFSNKFLLSPETSKFTVRKESVIKAFGWDARFYLYHKNGTRIEGDSIDLNEIIQPGEYVFKIEPYGYYTTCPAHYIDFLIEDVENLSKRKISCSGTKKIPNLPNSIGNNYLFVDNETVFEHIFESTRDEKIFGINLNLSQAAYFAMDLDFDFALNDVFMYLYEKDSKGELFLRDLSKNRYNQHSIGLNLNAGEYVVEAFADMGPTKSCFLYTLYLETSLPNYATGFCDGSEKLPTTYNSFRFLDLNNDFYFTPIFHFELTKGVITRATSELEVSDPSNLFVVLPVFDNLVSTSITLMNINTEVAKSMSYRGETVLKAYVPTGLYTIVVTLQYNDEYGPSTTDVCFEISGRVAVKPSNYYKNEKCVTNQIEKEFTITEATHFDRKRATFGNPNEYYQTLELKFNLYDTFDSYFEIGFIQEIVSSSAVLYLDSYAGSYGSILQVNKRTVTIPKLPAGRYILVLEMLLNKDQFDCFMIDYKFDFTKPIVPSHFEIPFPANLNQQPYFFQLETHFANQFVIFPAGTKQTTSTLTLPDANDYILRISARYVNEGFEKYDRISVKVQNATEATANYWGIVNGTVQIVFNTEETEKLAANVEMAVQRKDLFVDDLQRVPVQECTKTPLNDIVLDQNGGYSSFQRDMTISSRSITKPTAIIHTKEFVLEATSFITAVVRSDFLSNHLEIRISMKGAKNYIFGKNFYNQNQLKASFAKGTYVMEIYSAYPVSGLVGFCAMYDFGMSISRDSTGSECLDLPSMPTDLNAATGGSEQFGGPLQGDFLKFHATKLKYPKTVTHENMTFKLDQKAHISIQLTYDLFNTADVSLLKGTEIIKPTINEYNQNHQQTVLFVVDKGNYTFSFSYFTSLFASCPSFSLAVDIRPAHLVEAMVECPPSPTFALPKATVVLDADGVGAEYVFSQMDASMFGMAHWIGFNLAKQSRVVGTINYQPLANHLTMTLHTKLAGENTLVATSRGTYNPGDIRTPAGATVTVLLEAGEHSLRLFQPLIDLPFNTTGKCYPYSFSLSIMPTTTGLPFVASVTPPSIKYAAKPSRLEVIVSLSEPIRRDLATETAVRSAFFLMGADNREQIPCQGAKASNTSTIWTISFDSTKLKEDVNYLLTLKNTLLDESGIAFRLTSTNTYIFAQANCGGHGQLVQGTCRCADGYSGFSCENCTTGYKRIDDTCKAMTSCDDACACTTSGDKCLSNAKKCNIVEGHARCTCHPMYAGQWCDRCNSPEEYPNCTYCRLGHYDRENSKCICNAHAEGERCDMCSLGWKGSECNEKDKKDDSTKVVVVVVVVLAVVLVLGGLGVGLYFFRRHSKEKNPYSTVVGKNDLQMVQDEEDKEDSLDNVEQVEI